jgi:non-homologous end joining protein Ku
MAARVKKRADTATNRESDKIITRLPKGMRPDLAKLAGQRGRSVNAEVVRALTQYVHLELGVKPEAAATGEGYLLSEHGLYNISKRLEAGVGALEQLFFNVRDRWALDGPVPTPPDANWKGLLRLSLVTCPVALYAATSHASPLIRGTSQTIEIDQFVPRSELDPVYTHHSYYLVPNGKVGHDAFAVIREALQATNKVALARLELDNGEPIIIALEARDVGMLAMLLRRPSEVRDPGQYFKGVQDVHVTKDMLDLSRHIVEMKSGHFDPQQPEEAPLKKKAPVSTESPSNVINLMDALKKSLGGQVRG